MTAQGRHDERCYCVDCLADRLGFMERPRVPVLRKRIVALDVAPEPKYYQRSLGTLPWLGATPWPLVAAIAGAAFMLGVMLGVTLAVH